VYSFVFGSAGLDKPASCRHPGRGDGKGIRPCLTTSPILPSMLPFMLQGHVGTGQAQHVRPPACASAFARSAP
jgi:hypothetical protein